MTGVGALRSEYFMLAATGATNGENGGEVCRGEPGVVARKLPIPDTVPRMDRNAAQGERVYLRAMCGEGSSMRI